MGIWNFVGKIGQFFYFLSTLHWADFKARPAVKRVIISSIYPKLLKAPVAGQPVLEKYRNFVL